MYNFITILHHSSLKTEEKSSSGPELPIINLPLNYNPMASLNQVEMLFNFVLKMSRKIPDDNLRKNFLQNDILDMQMAVKQAVHHRRIQDMQVII